MRTYQDPPTEPTQERTMTNPTQRRHDEILGRLDALIDAVQPPIETPAPADVDHRPEERPTMSDITYEPVREDWTPYEPWMRDVLADDARVSSIHDYDDREVRQPWGVDKRYWDADHAATDTRVHPDDVPERPTEDDPDEALAALIEPLLPCMPDQVSSLLSLKIARAAREHISRNQPVDASPLLEREREEQRERADKAEAERDEWKARYEALRGDVEEVVAHFEGQPTAEVHPRHVARRITWVVLDRDDERDEP